MYVRDGVSLEVSEDAFELHYVNSQADADLAGRILVDSFNATLFPSEKPSRLIKVEVGPDDPLKAAIRDRDLEKPHMVEVRKVCDEICIACA